MAAAAVAAFILVYGQSPLFTQNQNAYLLAPAARAGYGYLANDWLANQAFPFRLFNALAEATFRTGQLWLFHAYHAVLAAIYFVSLVSLAVLLCPREQRSRAVWFAAGVVILIHIPVGELIGRWTGVALREPLAFLTNGLADQHLFGREFQPSAFGVLSLSAIALLQAGRPAPALLALALAAYMHPSYVVMNGIVVAGWVLHGLFQGEWRRSLAIAVAWAVLSIPIVIDLVRLTGGAEPHVVSAGQAVLVHRIPMHTDPSIWFGAGSVLKLALMLVGGLLIRRQIAGWILLLGFTVCVVSILWMTWSFSPALALTFPWRISVVLVPAATAVLIARAWQLIQPIDVPRRVPAVLLVVILAGSALSGGYLLDARRSDRRQASWMGLAAHARATAGPGSVYLLPPSEGPHKAYWDLQGFRLASGVPSYVDATSHPVAPDALVVWGERLDFAKSFYRRDRIDCPAVAELIERGISHLVLPGGTAIDCAAARRVHADEVYAIYALR